MVMIRMIIENYDDTLKVAILNNIIEKLNENNIEIAWHSIQPYWKDEKQVEGIIAVHLPEDISIYNVAEKLACNWQYEFGLIEDVAKQTTKQNEEALWSKNINQEEACIHKNIVWIQIYKW